MLEEVGAEVFDLRAPLTHGIPLDPFQRQRNATPVESEQARDAVENAEKDDDTDS